MMSNFDPAFATIETLDRLLTKKKISPVELTRLFLDRIARLDGHLNAFRTVTAERALEDARVAEKELMRGRHRGPLHGIPITLKDNIQTRGIRTTAGSAILRDFVPKEDATVAQRLRRAGAVLLGKTNLHEFAYGVTCENPHYGATRNPWNTDRISGGSSGGSTAAIAAGLCVASIGTDTGGSIRIPAALCGIAGLKPTFGRVSVHGVLPLATSFDHVGPLARSVTDAGTLLAVIARRDSLDPTTIARPTRELQIAARKSLKRVRLGVSEYFWGHLDPEIRTRAEAAVKWMGEKGAEVRNIPLLSLEENKQASNIVALAEARYVHEAAGFFPARAAEYGEDVRSRLERGGGVRAVDYLAARKELERSKAELAAAFEQVDAIVAPTTPVAAPVVATETVREGAFEESVRDALVRLNRPANFAGLPSISLPCGFTREGLPVGLQIIGRPFEEALILGIARYYEEQHDWHTKHPPMG
jgi:aspartyl-tRNA(Asn)/glutamyl-tRNA(Gln) amidotransferase subunit A